MILGIQGNDCINTADTDQKNNKKITDNQSIENCKFQDFDSRGD
jgi:hypothetical protein